MADEDDGFAAHHLGSVLPGRRQLAADQAEQIWPSTWPAAADDDDDDDVGAADGPGRVGGAGRAGGAGRVSGAGRGGTDRTGPAGPAGWARVRWSVAPHAAVAVAALALVVIVLAVFVLLRRGAPAGSPVALRPSSVAPSSAPPADPVSGSPTAAASGSGAPGAVSPSAGGAELRIYVVGQVRRPGVVSVPAGARVEDAVQAAGGATDGADLAAINLARPVLDGEEVIVPRPGQRLPAPADLIPAAGTGSGSGGSAGSTPSPGTPVNLNTATLAQLDALPGVGPVIAGRIVAWRQQNGRFTRVDDLAEVAGIGEATMARLRPLVRV